eukprot:SAG25_NODE_1375_length_3172_cov_1.819069_4_plen_70_part_01
MVARRAGWSPRRCCETTGWCVYCRVWVRSCAVTCDEPPTYYAQVRVLRAGWQPHPATSRRDVLALLVGQR